PPARRSSLDAAGLVDHLHRGGEAGQIVSVGGRLAALRLGLDGGVASAGQRDHDRAVGRGVAGPGAVLVREQREFLAVDIEHRVAIALGLVAEDEIDDVRDLVRRTVRHAHPHVVGLGMRSIDFFRLADDEADLAAGRVVDIGLPRASTASAAYRERPYCMPRNLPESLAAATPNRSARMTAASAA